MYDHGFLQGFRSSQLGLKGHPLGFIRIVHCFIESGFSGSDYLLVMKRNSDTFRLFFPGKLIYVPGMKTDRKKGWQFQLFRFLGEEVEYQGNLGVSVVGVGMDVDVVQVVVVVVVVVCSDVPLWRGQGEDFNTLKNTMRLIHPLPPPAGDNALSIYLSVILA